MSESSQATDSDWYSDPGVLLGELRRSRLKSSRRPELAGYEDLREIRRGGQGDVYSAFHRATRRRVAIKVLLDRAYAAEASRVRFEREIDLVAGLQHPNIVRVYDRGITDEGMPYFSMEYIDGVPLDEYFRMRAEGEARSDSDASARTGRGLRAGRAAEILRLFSRICGAISFAHQRGVIHRDLKPSNILIDTDGEPHVLDFGLAKGVGPQTPEQAEATVTLTGEFMGTLAYAAPEQVAGDASQIDIRTDVYALGGILYEMLTGRRPFSTAVPVADLIRTITETEPDPPSTAPVEARSGPAARWPPAAGLDDEIDTIVLRALARSPDRRYQSVAALRDDVERYLRGEPIEAKRDSSRYLLRKTIHRYRIPLSIGAAFVILIAGFGVAMAVLYSRANREARRARQEATKANQIRVFLEDTLGSVGSPAEGREVTLREVLDEAEHWIEIALSGQPEVAASLHNTIGNSYRVLGRYDKAERHLLSALAIRRRRFGGAHPEVAQSLNALALLRGDQGDSEEAERLLNEALALRRRLLGDDHLQVAMTLQNLGILIRKRGDDPAKAGRLFRRALAIRRAKLGAGHPDVAMCQYQLARLAEEQGDVQTADRLHLAALRARRAALDAAHPDVARSLMALGNLRLRLGRAGEAEPLLRECVEIMREVVPPGHWRLAEAEGAWGTCLAALGRYEEAEALLVRSHTILARQRGADDGLTVQAQRRLEDLYTSWGRPERSVESGVDAGEEP